MAGKRNLAKLMAKKKPNESLEECENRLILQCERQKRRLEMETPEQRAKRLEYQRVRQNQKHQNETAEERAKRLEYQRIRQNQRYRNETPEQRAHRLSYQRTRQVQKNQPEEYNIEETPPSKQRLSYQRYNNNNTTLISTVKDSLFNYSFNINSYNDNKTTIEDDIHVPAHPVQGVVMMQQPQSHHPQSIIITSANSNNNINNDNNSSSTTTTIDTTNNRRKTKTPKFNIKYKINNTDSNNTNTMPTTTITRNSSFPPPLIGTYVDDQAIIECVLQSPSCSSNSSRRGVKQQQSPRVIVENCDTNYRHFENNIKTEIIFFKEEQPF